MRTETTDPSAASSARAVPKATSVYLTSETTAEVITRNHPGTLLVELTIAEVRAQGLDVQRENIPGDPGHCNIIGRKTRSLAKTFAEICRWTLGFGP